MRKIKLSPTVDLDGSKIENEDVVVYDTSGPYTDTNYTVDLQKGLPKLRENWIEERQDTVKLEGLSSEYGRMRQEDKSLDSLRFEHVNTHPRIAREGAQVSQYTMPVRESLPRKWSISLSGKINWQTESGKNIKKKKAMIY